MSEAAPLQPAAEPAAGGSRVVAIVDLLIRPDRFFPEGARRLGTPLLLLLVLALGAASVIDRMETAALRQSVRGLPVEVSQSWVFYWSAVAGGAVLAGPLLYFVFGWWYRVRLRWSGARDADPSLARRVYLLSSAVASIPMIALSAVDTWRYPSPGLGLQGLEPIAASAYVAPFWSIFVSYYAVLASFPVDRARARLWFAILPSLVFVGVYAFVVLLAWGWIG